MSEVWVIIGSLGIGEFGGLCNEDDVVSNRVLGVLYYRTQLG